MADLYRLLQIIIMFAIVFAVAAASETGSGDRELLLEARQWFKPLPNSMASETYPAIPERVVLGRMLFFEPRASLDGTVSCARCHLPSLYGTDSLRKGIGVRDRENPRNVPTVLNAALQFTQHWRGDRANVEEQAKQALIGPASFGQPDYASAMAKLKAIPEYGELFSRAFPADANPVNEENWAKAIGAFERTLVTPAPFDSFLKGDLKAISDKAKSGLKIFITSGCSSCHGGAGVGGNLFMKFGLFEDYWLETKSKNIDHGRFDVTHDEGDTYVFKVPSLRNVAMTPPYFHDGSVDTLPDAVRVMGKVQLNKELSEAEVGKIVSFLQTLSGPIPESFSTVPKLPAAAFK